MFVWVYKKKYWTDSISNDEINNVRISYVGIINARSSYNMHYIILSTKNICLQKLPLILFNEKIHQITLGNLTVKNLL